MIEDQANLLKLVLAKRTLFRLLRLLSRLLLRVQLNSSQLFCWVIGLLGFTLSGCSALFPLEGNPAWPVPYEFNAPQRSMQETIDLSLLRQNPPTEHLVDGGDILGVYIEGVLGNAQNTPPVFVPAGNNAIPSIGYPIRVDMDGTISLPMLDPLPVRGLTIAQVRQVVRDAYTRGPKAIIQPGRDQIHVSLQKARTHRVIVIREESGNEQGNRGPAGTVNFEMDKRGTGRVVHLPAHSNDVLNALTETGGLPGLDAENVIYIIRGQPTQQVWQDVPPQNLPTQQNMQPQPDRVPTQNQQPKQNLPPQPNSQYQPQSPYSNSQILQTSGTWHPANQYQQDGVYFEQSINQDPQAMTYPSGSHIELGPEVSPPQFYDNMMYPTEGAYYPDGTVVDGMYPQQGYEPSGRWPNIVRIPLRLYPGEPLPFRPEDIILNDGDIVFVENRVTEFYYTAGLLGGRQLALPRDYDIGIMDAIALAEAERFQNLPTAALGGVSVLNQDVTVGASRVIVQRKLPNGQRIPIKVNLYDVMENPDQQILIQPEDRIILRYTRTEAALAFFERYILEGFVIGATSALTFRN